MNFRTIMHKITQGLACFGLPHLALLLLVGGVLISLFLFLPLPRKVAARQQGTDGTTRIQGEPVQAVQSAVVNFRDMEKLATVDGVVKLKSPGPPRLLPDMPVPEGAQINQEAPREADPQQDQPFPPSPGPAASFQGLADNNTTIPPDTHGAAGPNHIMTVANSQIRIQTRAGAQLSLVSLDSFWAPLSTPDDDAFDPKVLYDPYGKRWMFTVTANSRSANSAVLIAVSQTTDPTGVWNLFKFDADSANILWADYPSMGFNKDWIVVQVNMFPISAGTFRSQIFTFNKANLYAGTGTATVFNDSTIGGTQVPAITYDNQVSTMYLINNWNGNSGGNGHLRMFTITGAVGAETLTAGAFISTPNPWSNTSAAANFAPQSGSASGIANNDNRLQEVIYRNGTLWTTHTIFLPAGAVTRSAVQWWQVGTDATILQRARIDDATGATFYAFPSLAVNASNDMLIGYSRFSATQFASGNYAFRSGTDTLNTLRDDTVLKAGEAPYFKTFGGTTNRWGDYSSTVVDPVNDNEMWTVQEYAGTPVGGACSPNCDRWGTWWGRIGISTMGQRDTVAVFRPSTAVFYERNSHTSGAGDASFGYGISTDVPVVGDWNGDGIDSIGIFRNGVFHLRNNNSVGAPDIVFAYGAPGDIPVIGDWNGDGVDTIGVFRNGIFYLRNTNNNGFPDLTIFYGAAGDVPVTGDWDGNGTTTIGIYRSNVFHLRNSNTNGGADLFVTYGAPGDIPVVGDWDLNGTTTVGVFRNGLFLLRNSNTNGVAELAFILGTTGDKPLAGNWDGLPKL